MKVVRTLAQVVKESRYGHAAPVLVASSLPEIISHDEYEGKSGDVGKGAPPRYG